MKLAAAAAALLALCACAQHAKTPPPTAAQPARRIVSLMPSFTEDLCAIGAGRQIIGVSQYSSDIPCVKGVPEIGNFASLDVERIIRLHPDAVVAIPAQRAMTAPLRRLGIATQFLKDDAFEDIFTDIGALGRLSGHDAQARDLAASLREKTRRLQASEHFHRRARVFFVEQAMPIWTVGPQSYISTLIDLAGGRNAVQSLPQAYAQYSPEALVRLAPDAIVATGDANLTPLLGRQPWTSLRAVREHRVFVLNDPAVLVRPGPRYNEGLAWLIERLRPISK